MRLSWGSFSGLLPAFVAGLVGAQVYQFLNTRTAQAEKPKVWRGSRLQSSIPEAGQQPLRSMGRCRFAIQDSARINSGGRSR